MVEWRKFKTNMKEKRLKGNKKEKSRAVPDTDSIVVQSLSAEVSGKAQKYTRVGAREFVDYREYEEFTISNIKHACISHYGIDDTVMSCDVLAGEQGPSLK